MDTKEIILVESTVRKKIAKIFTLTMKDVMKANRNASKGEGVNKKNFELLIVSVIFIMTLIHVSIYRNEKKSTEKREKKTWKTNRFINA